MTAFIFDNGLSDKKDLNISTLAGDKTVEMDIKGKLLGNIKVDMGKPIFDPKEIPVDLDFDEVFNYKISISNRVFSINCLSMGNPHCVIYIDEAEELERLPIEVWGPAIEKYQLFPNKTNVEFIKTADVNRIEMRVWERGVGETLACGTGACAAGVCSIKMDKISGSEVNVKLPGGNLNILWDSPSGNVFLEGSVQHVFGGVYYLS
jgi:diaminopimelate epimerase